MAPSSMWFTGFGNDPGSGLLAARDGRQRELERSLAARAEDAASSGFDQRQCSRPR